MSDTDGMSKYGVVEPENLRDDKTADEKGTEVCPVCRTPIETLETTNVKKCPNCGTLPFER